MPNQFPESPSSLSGASASWRAELELDFVCRASDRSGETETVLTRRHHSGPLRVQKTLFPEGRQVCHAIVLHPPAGIAGGDELDIRLSLGAQAHVLLTTPGAGKWYRTSGPMARQTVTATLSAGACLEWLPQENIVFSGARAGMQASIDLQPGARFLGVETVCFGRRASGEHFDRGTLKLHTAIKLDGKPLWREMGQIDGGSPLLASPVGLAGYSVCSTVLAAGFDGDPEALERCRMVGSVEPTAQCGVSQLPSLFVGRYLGHSAEAAREWLIDLWKILRPGIAGREAVIPRIWHT